MSPLLSVASQACLVRCQRVDGMPLWGAAEPACSSGLLLDFSVAANHGDHSIRGHQVVFVHHGTNAVGAGQLQGVACLQRAQMEMQRAAWEDP